MAEVDFQALAAGDLQALMVECLGGTVEFNPVKVLARPFYQERQFPFWIRLGREEEAMRRLKWLLTNFRH